MTNLKSVNTGYNKYCCPAVLSILTGKTTDECAEAISRISGKAVIDYVQVPHLVKAADNLGFIWTKLQLDGVSLFRAITAISNADGIYAVVIATKKTTSHIVCVEINNGHAYFNDNHTKEPIPAASSARMMQKVLEVYHVAEKPKPELLPIDYRLRLITRMMCAYCGATTNVDNEDHSNAWQRMEHFYECRYRIALEANK